jgi:mRNA interferase MazF
MAVTPKRGDVVLVHLDPTRGSEIRKTRPCVVISPDELNRHLRTLIVAPMTTGGQAYPWRVPCRFQQRDGFIALDQVRTVDRERLSRKLGRLAPAALGATLALLHELFAP